MTPDDSALLHAAPYDPQKAREYYLRTRKLKGRHPGQPQPVPVHRTSGGSASKAKHHRTSAEVHKEARARLKSLEAKLTKLKALLAKLKKQQTAKAAKHPIKKQTAAEKAKAAKDKKPLTAAQKHAAAARAKKSYEKNKKTSPAKAAPKSASDVQAEIKQIQEKIRAIRKQLEKG